MRENLFAFFGTGALCLLILILAMVPYTFHYTFTHECPARPTSIPSYYIYEGDLSLLDCGSAPGDPCLHPEGGIVIRGEGPQ